MAPLSLLLLQAALTINPSELVSGNELPPRQQISQPGLAHNRPPDHWTNNQPTPVPGARRVGPKAAFSQGLRAEYYNGREFEEKVLTRREKQVDFVTYQAPHPRVNGHLYSARWTGKLRPPTTGTYTLVLHSDNGARLWLDGKLIMDDWDVYSSQLFREKIDLEAGRYYDLVIEYYNHYMPSFLILSWVLPPKHNSFFEFLDEQSYTVIAPEYFFTEPLPDPVPPVVIKERPAPAQPPMKPAVASRKVKGNRPILKKRAQTILPPLPAKTILAIPPEKTAVVLNRPTAPRLPLAINTLKANSPEDASQTWKVGDPITLHQVQFEQSKARFRPGSYPELAELVRLLQRHPALRIEIAGHTDNNGPEKLNQILSEQRAQRIRDYLLKKDIARSRITAKGYGSRLPKTDNSTEAGRAQNRRVEIVIKEQQ